jgi:hypothetical protein
MNVAVIAACAVRVLYPPARRIGPFVLVYGLVVAPAYFWGLIRRAKQEGHGDRSIAQLYDDVRQGRRRLRSHPIEWAALAAIVLATFFAP